MERPLAVIGFTYLSALLVALFLGVQVSLFLVIVFLAAFIASLFIKPVRKTSIIPVVLITSAVAMFSFGAYSIIYVKPIEKLEGKTASVTATLCDIPYEQNGRYYYKLETKEIGIANVIQNTKILVSSKTAYDIELYDNITATIRLYENSGNTYTNYYISKGIMLHGSIDDYSEITISRNSEKPLYYYALTIKRSMTEAINELLPEKEAQFITALLLGDKTGISSDDKKLFSSAGISHIISISGFHVAVITQIFIFFLCLITKRKRLSSIICTFIIFAFMAVVGFSPSVVRAGIMQIIYLVGKSIIRQSDSLNSLGFAALIICFLNPYSVADVGFLLSFCATLGIIICSKKITIFIYEHMYKSTDTVNPVINKYQKIIISVFKSVVSIISITVSANVFTLPITIVYFKQFATYSLISNLMISFAASVLIFSSVIMVLLQMTGIFSFLTLPFAIISGVLSNYIMWVAEFISSIPFSTITVSDEFIPFWIGLMLTLAAFIYILKDRKRTIRYFAFVVVLTFAVGIVSNNILKSGRFKVSVLDVGQGLSIVLTDGNETSIISCGGKSAYTSVLNNYLENSSTEYIYYLLLLSDNDESCAYAKKLMSEFPVENLQVYSEENYYENMHRLILQSKNIILSDSGSTNTVYWHDITIKTTENNGNTAVYFTKNNISFLVCNNNMDCSILPEEWRNPNFLIVDGTLQNFELISPEYIVISDNYENLSYDIPQLSLLSEHIYATGNNGNLALWIYNDNTMSIRRENEWLS